MSFDTLTCATCGSEVKSFRNPFPTVDIIIEVNDGIILIERKNPPFGWALPGGFVDYGESLEDAAIREAKEETSLEVHSLQLLGCYSDPDRDSRMHTISAVYVGRGVGTPSASDDALNLATFRLDSLPKQLCFDHALILSDYSTWKSLHKD